MARVGLIGLGLLGSAMCARLRAAGHEVIGYDIDPAKTQAQSAEEAARAGNILLLSLPDSNAVASVLDLIEPVLQHPQQIVPE